MEEKIGPIYMASYCFVWMNAPLAAMLCEEDFLFAIVSPTEFYLAPTQGTWKAAYTQEIFVE